MTTYKSHPYAELFPMLTPEEITELAQDILQNGQRAAIVLHEGKILDGRNRYAACLEAKILPVFKDLPPGKDALAWVMSANLHRRHITQSQRAMIAAKLETMLPGRPIVNKEATGPIYAANEQVTQAIPRKVASRMASASVRSTTRAAKVLAESPALTAQVEAGAITVTDAVKELTALHAELAPKLGPEKLAPILDANGREVPEKLRALWVRAGTESKELIRRLRALKSVFEDAEQAEDLAFVEMSCQTATGSLESVITGVKRVTPYALCPTCSGVFVSTCDACKGKGYVSKYFWDNCVPKEFKALKL